MDRTHSDRPGGSPTGGKQKILTALAFVLLAGLAVTGAGVWVTSLRSEERARKAEQQAVTQQDEAKKAEADFKGQLLMADAQRKTMQHERDRALAAEREAQRSAEDTRSILDFLRRKLLSAGRPGDVSLTDAFWNGGQGKDLTLLKAVESAEPQVTDAFADRPLAEASVREMLGLTYLNLGQAPQAVEQYNRALALREAMQGGQHADTAACRNQLAVALRFAGRTGEAGRLFDRAPDSPAHADALAVRGSILLHQKKPADAELKLRESLAIREKIAPAEWTTFETKSLLGEALVAQKKFADSEPLLLSGYEGMKQRQDTIPSPEKPRLIEAIGRLVTLYTAWGKADKAMNWQKQLRPAGNAAKP